MLTASCNSILSSKPSGTLSEEQMADLLVDIHLTEATLRIANDSIARLNDTTDLRIRFAQVFRKNDVEPDDFNISLNYYIKAFGNGSKSDAKNGKSCFRQNEQNF